MSFGKSRYLEEFIMWVLSKQSVDQGRNCPKICVHQVVTNCCSCNYFPNVLKFWTLLLNFVLLRSVWIAELYCLLLQIWIMRLNWG